VNDIHGEFNPTEAKQSPLITVKRDVVKGVDEYWNSLRVLPSPKLTYPDFKRDGANFYDLICCLSLKRKYAPDSMRSEQVHAIAIDFKSIVE
jgi:hypothetical protein